MGRCIPCMSATLKDAILQKFDVAEELAKVPSCSPGMIVDMCTAGGAAGAGGRRGKSDYQVFIGKCLTERKGKPGPITEKMRECAVEWRKVKPQ